MPNKLKPDFFNELLLRFNKIHNHRYDYSRAVYRGVAQKIEIICPVHGSFLQTPKNHQLGQRCPKCADNQHTDTRSLIAEFRRVHGRKYQYHKVDYSGKNTPVEIVCESHGSFWQRPNDHRGGRGCKHCGYEKMRTPRLKYLERFNLSHKNRYQYDISQPISLTSKVKIRCPVHHWFEQRADHHLSGQGCPKCNVNQNKNIKQKNLKTES